jgi:GxxExxY protein
VPITFRIPIRRLSQPEFGDIAYEVMRRVFAIHNEIGRFFDEKIYKQELAQRMSGVRLEEPIEVTFGSFRKPYFLDVLVADGGFFEFKSVESLAGRHRAQFAELPALRRPRTRQVDQRSVRDGRARIRAPNLFAVGDWQKN